MRILLDECVPRPLRHELPGHDVRTVPEMGWAGKKNGELLQLMAQQAFEVFLTVDQNLRFQQNLSGAGVGIIVLVAPTNRLADLVPLMSRSKRH
jgi:PIN like domain